MANVTTINSLQNRCNKALAQKMAAEQAIKEIEKELKSKNIEVDNLEDIITKNKKEVENLNSELNSKIKEIENELEKSGN